MDPYSPSITIDAPPELVYGFLVDIANYPSFLDHLFVDWHLLREDPRGPGAGARFRMKLPFNRFAWGDLTFSKLEEGRLIVAEGRMGKANRIPIRSVHELRPGPGGTTRLTHTFQTQPRLPSDRLVDGLDGFWLRRGLRRSLVRLRELLEQAARSGGPPPTVKRVTVADG